MERKEAIEVIKKNWPNSSFTRLREALKTLIPELKESEDEGIKKAVLWCINTIEDDFGYKVIKGFTATKLKSWLKKQGEQKPVEEYNITGIGSKHAEGKLGEMIKNLESVNEVFEQKPAAWTKEDKERYISCLQKLGTGNSEQPETINSKWFKEHVYPQPTWKPSDEHIKTLEFVIESIDNMLLAIGHIDNTTKPRLKEILAEIKKLREG